ncbi:hypothetical protein BC828DRAFT_382363, partial [Blastocladiella britannica]
MEFLCPILPSELQLSSSYQCWVSTAIPPTQPSSSSARISYIPALSTRPDPADRSRSDPTARPIRP